MGKILKDFIRQMPTLQSKQIEAEVYAEKDRGEITTPAQFRAEFQSRLRALLESDDQLRFSFREFLVDSKKSSELMTGMFGLLLDDLTALFGEINQQAELIDRQASILKENVLAGLRGALNEAEREVLLFEELNGVFNGLTVGLVENFRSTSGRLSRNTPGAEEMYSDPKRGVRISAELDMPVEPNVGGLVLPAKTQDTVVFSLIQDQTSSDVRALAEAFAIASEIEPSTESDFRIESTGNISNVIDRTTGTFWLKRIVKKAPLPGGAKLALTLHLGTSRPINFIEIQPISNFSLEIVGIYAMNPTGSLTKIDIGTTIVTEPTRLFFREIECSKILVSFSQKSSTLQEVTQQNVVSIAHKYEFGLDNILAGRISYQDLGVYVSKPVLAKKISKIRLRTKESQSMADIDDLSSAPELGTAPAIEYWVHVREYDQNDSVTYMNILPICPVNKTEIKERILIDGTGLASTMFAIYEDLAVWRNGVELVQNVDYEIVNEIADIGAAIVGPMSLDLHTSNLSEQGVVAVYTPLHTRDDSPIEFMDRTNTIVYHRDSSIEIRRPSGSNAVRTEINLLVIMRNVGSNRHTAIVNEFALTAG